MNPSPLKRQNLSLTTLALVLLVLLCQLFGDGELATVHYSDMAHPYGTQVAHTHHQHEHLCDCCQQLDHAHADHVHCSCHPPRGNYAFIDISQAEAVPFTLNHYRSKGYAPPLPPPNA